MSLILEALKKSEARRQLGEAPGLGTPFTVARRRRSPLPVIVILIVAAGAFGWYFLGSGPAPPSATKPSVPGSPDPRNAPGKGTFVTATPAQPGAGASRANTAMAGRPGIGQAARPMLPTPVAKNAGAPAADAAQAQRPSMPAKLPSVVASGEGSAKPEPAEAARAAAASAKPAMATAAPQPGATVVPQPAPPPAPAATTAPATAQTHATQTAAPAPPPAPAAPPVPQYYELPYNLRKDLPALNVTMHVYAATPAQRFILIDGERKGEGESLKDGLTVREIRNDGIIMEFRGQQFFYPRPGR